VCTTIRRFHCLFARAVIRAVVRFVRVRGGKVAVKWRRVRTQLTTKSRIPAILDGIIGSGQKIRPRITPYRKSEPAVESSRNLSPSIAQLLVRFYDNPIL